MAQMVDGKWVDTAPAAEEVGKDGRFQRKDSSFRGTILPDADAALPALAGYLRELYQWPGTGGTVNFDQIKRGYYQLADKHGIIAIGPRLDLTTPHGRVALPGRDIRERPMMEKGA